ncbi:MAG: Chromate resistance protein ChrB [Candidatus Dormibacteria bacterium]
MPRIALWCQLPRVGALQIVEVALPASPKTRERMEWLAEEAREAGGWASVWLARPGLIALERDLAGRMAAATAGEYSAVIEEARAALTLGEVARRRTLAKLRRDLGRIGERDYFPPPERQRTHAAVARLVDRVSARTVR